MSFLLTAQRSPLLTSYLRFTSTRLFSSAGFTGNGIRHSVGNVSNGIKAAQVIGNEMLVGGKNVARFGTVHQSNPEFFEKQKKLGRPLSPHITIYSFPLAAWSSVATRITGGLLTIGMYGTGISCLLGADVAGIYSSIGSSGLAPVAKFCVVFPLAYHTLAGFRHIYWENFPDGLNAQTQMQAAAVLFSLSGVTALAAAFL